MIQLNYGYTFFVTTELAGVATAADSTPTAVLYRNGSASGVAVTVAATAVTGLYKLTFTSLGTGDGWAVTDVLHLIGFATIDGTSNYTRVVWDSTGDVDAAMRGTNLALTDKTGFSLSELALSDVQSEVNDALVALSLDNALVAQGAERAVSVDNSHRVHSHVYDMQANTLTANALAADAVAEIQSGLALESTAQEILTDTGTTLPSQISGISGGGGIVNVLPATGIVADRTPGATLTPVVGETVSQSITLYQSDGTTAVDLSGKTLAIVFEAMNGVDVAVVGNADITVSGDSSNVVTFAYPSTVTETERVLRFAIRDAAAPLTMYLQGVCSVVAAPKVD